MALSAAPAASFYSPHDHPDFAGTPWAAALLSSPTTIPYRSGDILVEQPTPGRTNSLTAVTLNTPFTFRALAVVTNPSGDVCLLFSLGSGMNGHESVLHGGMVTTMLDISTAAAMNTMAFTAYLNVTFKKPVPTPTVVLCRGKVVKREGRKIFVTATVEDGVGGVYAEGNALFIKVREPAKL
ncbi:HotDog domain-containing protein [Tricharina praecox]|uniref:HotDog domain-containing protein n=1 Tax=Tricharina praecox TaxID=43433 RepID=UPI00221FEEC0|nr:HotDog domain-containing protein [Tricharina praecox]KAI5854233.1 HotDog domain-containing protein [Tricharina praecox]